MPRRPNLPDRPHIRGGVSDYLRRLGLWNDPGSGRFIRRGMSTEKARTLFLDASAPKPWFDVREAARNADGATIRARVVDNRMRRGGLNLGDIVDVRYRSDDKAQVQITTRDGSRRWYDVQWQRFESIPAETPEAERLPYRSPRLRNSRTVLTSWNRSPSEWREVFAAPGFTVEVAAQGGRAKRVTWRSEATGQVAGRFTADPGDGTGYWKISDFEWTSPDVPAVNVLAPTFERMAGTGENGVYWDGPGYLMARAGFDWRTGGTATRKAIASDIAALANDTSLPQDVRDEAARLGRLAGGDLPSDPTDWPVDLPTPNDLALVGYTPGATTWPGKEILDRHGFLGDLRFTESMARSLSQQRATRLDGVTDPEELFERLPASRDAVNDMLANVDGDMLVATYDWLQRTRGAPALARKRDVVLEWANLRLAIADARVGGAPRADYHRHRPAAVTDEWLNGTVTAVNEAVGVDKLAALTSRLRGLRSSQPDMASYLQDAALIVLDALDDDDTWRSLIPESEIRPSADPDPDERVRREIAGALVRLAEGPSPSDIRVSRRSNTPGDPIELTEAQVLDLSSDGSRHATYQVTRDGSAFTVSTGVRGPDGVVAANVTQVVDPENRAVTLTVDGPADSGAISGFLANAIEGYTKAGFEYLAVPDASQATPAHLASSGFDWAPGSDDHLALADVAEAWADTAVPAVTASLQDLAARLRAVPTIPEDPSTLPDDFPTPADVFSLGRGTRHWVGRDLVEASPWRAVLRLNAVPEKRPPYLPNPRRPRKNEVDLSTLTNADIADIYTHDLGDGFRSTARVSGGHGSWSVSGSILDPNGNSVGHFSRSLNASKGTVSHSSFSMNRGSGGNGVGSRFIAASIRGAQRAGFRKINVMAAAGGSYNGSYTWARTGFDWQDRATPRTAVRYLQEKLGTVTDPDVRAEAETMIARLGEWTSGSVPDDFPTPNDVAMVGWDPSIGSGPNADWLGKQVMRSFSWNGVMRLEPSPRALPPSRPVLRIERTPNVDWAPDEADARRAFTHDLGDGITTVVNRVRRRRLAGAGEELVVSGQILDGEERIGSFTRIVSLDEPNVEFDSLSIIEERRGQGIGSRFVAASLDSLQALGARDVTTWALSGANNNGAYTWARAGYDWQNQGAARDMAAVLTQAVANNDFDPQVVDEINSMVGRLTAPGDPAGVTFPDDFPTPNDVAMIGYAVAAADGNEPSTWAGRQILTGSVSWLGRLSLAPLRGRTTTVVPIRPFDAVLNGPPDVDGDPVDQAAVERGREILELLRDASPLVRAQYGDVSWLGNQSTAAVGMNATGSLELLPTDANQWVDLGPRRYGNATVSIVAENPTDRALAWLGSQAATPLPVTLPQGQNIEADGRLVSVGQVISQNEGRWNANGVYARGGRLDWMSWPTAVAYVTEQQAFADVDVTRAEEALARQAGVRLMVVSPDGREATLDDAIRDAAPNVTVDWGGPIPLAPTGDPDGAYGARIRSTWMLRRRQSPSADLVPWHQRREFLRERRDAVAEVEVPIPTEAIAEVAENGRLRNAHQTRTTVGEINLSARRSAESYLFGIPETGTRSAKRPIDAVPVGDAPDVAGFRLVLSPEVLDRSTLTFGDPMSVARPNAEWRVGRSGRRTRDRDYVGTPTGSLHGRAIPVRGTVNDNAIDGAVGMPHANDVHVQVHGGVRVTDGTRVRYTTGSAIVDADRVNADLLTYAHSPIRGLPLQVSPAVNALLTPETLAALTNAGVAILVEAP